MSKVKYRYNTHTLSYEKIEVSLKEKILKGLSYVVVSMFFGMVFFAIAYYTIDSPKEKLLKQENAKLIAQYKLLNRQLDEVAGVLDEIQYRDDNIYRVIFEADPIPNEIRKAGFGGVNRYKNLEGYSNSDLMIETSKKLDKITKQLYIQSKSFDDVVKMAKEKEKMLAAIPAIQPVQNKDLKRLASGYGYRMHPILKYRKFHAGMDFTAPTGTPIYATGEGTVIQADAAASGYGKHVRIDHGYGYVSLYAHMSKIAVKPGQKVKRGDIIGYVGNTGLSAGPHCHYEVRKNGEPVNPVNYYFNDLTPEEYEKMSHLSEAPTQSLD
tara:strand:- start:51554 stop:52525 length:972 start_codon:yes stop_codon:yes gene_type:complete